MYIHSNFSWNGVLVLFKRMVFVHYKSSREKTKNCLQIVRHTHISPWHIWHMWPRDISAAFCLWIFPKWYLRAEGKVAMKIFEIGSLKWKNALRGKEILKCKLYQNLSFCVLNIYEGSWYRRQLAASKSLIIAYGFTAKKWSLWVWWILIGWECGKNC